MKNLIKLCLIAGIIGLVACGGASTKQSATTDSAVTVLQDSTTSPVFTAEMVDNKKDPTCGMPVTAGISDTTHYENKVLGFCSPECKNEFEKNPKASLAAAELK